MSLNYPEIKQDPPVKPGDPVPPVSRFDIKNLGRVLGGVFGGLGGLVVTILLFKWLLAKLRRPGGSIVQ